MPVCSFQHKTQALEPKFLKNSEPTRRNHNESILGLVEHESALSHLTKHENKKRRAKVVISHRVLDCKRLARKTGQRQCCLSLRKQDCKLLRSGKRRAFQLYKDQEGCQPEIREFCRLMDRLRPQKAWSVTVVDQRPNRRQPTENSRIPVRSSKKHSFCVLLVRLCRCRGPTQPRT